MIPLWSIIIDFICFLFVLFIIFICFIANFSFFYLTHDFVIVGCEKLNAFTEGFSEIFGHVTLLDKDSFTKKSVFIEVYL